MPLSPLFACLSYHVMPLTPSCSFRRALSQRARVTPLLHAGCVAVKVAIAPSFLLRWHEVVVQGWDGEQGWWMLVVKEQPV